MSSIERLRKSWQAQRINVPAGVPERLLLEFEQQQQVVLPADLRDYFLAMDGMGERGIFDKEIFCFWPLSEVVSIHDYVPDQSWRFSHSHQYYLFADVSIECPAFAIRLNSDVEEENTILWVHMFAGILDVIPAFGSFTEFLEAYLIDPWKTL